jgi:hypothetical protein
MRQLSILALVLWAGIAHGQILAGTRVASGDLDGDGKVEMILGGRSGAQGTLLVGEVRSNYVNVRAEETAGWVIRDVAVGDYAGNGTMDVFTVGDGQLAVHGYRNGKLTTLGEKRLQSNWTDRVAVLSEAGRTLVAVTEYEVRPDRDVGTMTVRGFRVEGGAFDQVWTLQVDSHIGDLSLVGGAPAHLVMETGTGDEGGDVVVYALENVPTLVWRDRVTDGRRCMSVQANGHAGVILQPIGKDAQVYRLSGGTPHYERHLVGTRGLHVTSHVSADGFVGMGLLRSGSTWSYRALID